MTMDFEEASARAAAEIAMAEQRRAAAFEKWHGVIAPVLQEASRIVGEDVMHFETAGGGE